MIFETFRKIKIPIGINNGAEFIIKTVNAPGHCSFISI